MCGRFVIATPMVSIFEYFDIPDPRAPQYLPRYNVAPTTPILLVRDDGETRTADTASWGFIPSWAKALDDGRRPINARAETVATSGLFRRAFAQRRCLIPADGFYEWQAAGGGRKQPYYIHRNDGEMLAFGGIWETWHAGKDDELTSAAIITTPANAAVTQLHTRMPLILERDDWDRWLLGDNPADLLLPADDDVLTWHAVDAAVGNIRNDNPSLIEPLHEN